VSVAKDGDVVTAISDQQARALRAVARYAFDTNANVLMEVRFCGNPDGRISGN
jgi:hypothetical protein